MRFALLCTIDPAKRALLAALRAEHYRYLVANRSAILFGGPLRADPEGPPEAMLMILERPTPTDAERFIAEEPYDRYGVFREVHVRAWTQVLPEPQPGALQHALEVELAAQPVPARTPPDAPPNTPTSVPLA